MSLGLTPAQTIFFRPLLTSMNLVQFVVHFCAEISVWVPTFATYVLRLFSSGPCPNFSRYGDIFGVSWAGYSFYIHLKKSVQSKRRECVHASSSTSFFLPQCSESD